MNVGAVIQHPRLWATKGHPFLLHHMTPLEEKVIPFVYRYSGIKVCHLCEYTLILPTQQPKSGQKYFAL